jgi:hypothetical protein
MSARSGGRVCLAEPHCALGPAAGPDCCASADHPHLSRRCSKRGDGREDGGPAPAFQTLLPNLAAESRIGAARQTCDSPDAGGGTRTRWIQEATGPQRGRRLSGDSWRRLARTRALARLSGMGGVSSILFWPSYRGPRWFLHSLLSAHSLQLVGSRWRLIIATWVCSRNLGPPPTYWSQPQRSLALSPLYWRRP